MVEYYLALVVLGLSWWFYPKTVDVYKLFFYVFFCCSSLFVLVKIVEHICSMIFNRNLFVIEMPAPRLIGFILIAFYGIYFAKSKR